MDKAKIKKLESQMRKGLLEMLVLQIISHKPIYVLEILEKLKKADLEVSEGTMYPLLSRLKREKLLEYKWQESTEGPPRKYYQISTAGKKYLKALLEVWQKTQERVGEIINNN